ncbi:MAG TPA: 4'-phosphopantetheinyl transferase superfamily protein [Oscillatoriaceae cyanobacterium]
MPAILHLVEATPGALKHAPGLLTPDEQAAFAHYTVPKRRREWLLGRLAAKQALAQLTGLQPSAVAIRKLPDGRPVFFLPEDRLPGWHLSISHSHHWAAALVAPGPAGVDLELMRVLPEGGHRFFLSERERAWLAGRPLGPHGAVILWALKEAAFKALEGALPHMRTLETEIHDGHARLRWSGGEVLAQYKEWRGFVLAIAAPAPADWLDQVQWPT